MELSTISDAGIGAVAGELLRALLRARETAASFRSNFDRLQTTLEAVVSPVNEIQRLNDELDRPRSEIDRLVKHLEDGQALVSKCSRVRALDYLRKYRYSKKIQKLDDDIRRFFNFDLRVTEARDVKQIRKEVLENRRKLDRLIDGGGGGAGMEMQDLPSLTVGLRLPLKEVKERLMKDGVSVVVVSGPAGSGKSTLALALCRERDLKEKFKQSIFYDTISSMPNWKATVEKLFRLQCHNDESAINCLAHLLRQRNQKPTLLVLDDVWQDSGSSLLVHKLLESPLPPCCKILITSRFTFPTFGCTYGMRLLNEEDSMTLFNHLAFPQDDTNDRPDQDLVDKIVSCCKGLPLAIVVVARSLCRQSEVVWRTTARKWASESKSIFEIDPTSYLLDRLATSLEVLDDSVKECFFDLGLFLEDQRIPSSALIDIWSQIYDLDDDGAYVVLLELYTRNLASLVVSTGKDVTKVDGCYNELFITQHDLLRELAIYKSSQQNIDQRKRIFTTGNELSKYKDRSRSFGAHLLSIFADDMNTSSWSGIQVPKVAVLILNISTRTFALPHFIENMDNLKVLNITNHGLYPAELQNIPQLDSLNNIRRIRLEKVSIPPINEIMVAMTSLRKISLVMCEVGSAFRKCFVEIANTVPNMVEIEIDYCNDLEELPVGLCNIVSLKKLSITNCHNLEALPVEVGKMTNLEVLRLYSCTGLSKLPNSIGCLSKLNFLDIADCISLRGLPEEVGQLHGLEKLNMRGCKDIASLSELPSTVMHLKQLKEVICDEEAADLWKCFQGHLKKLKIKVPAENANLNWRQI